MSLTKSMTCFLYSNMIYVIIVKVIYLIYLGLALIIGSGKLFYVCQLTPVCLKCETFVVAKMDACNCAKVLSTESLIFFFFLFSFSFLGLKDDYFIHNKREALQNMPQNWGIKAHKPQTPNLQNLYTIFYDMERPCLALSWAAQFAALGTRDTSKPYKEIEWQIPLHFNLSTNLHTTFSSKACIGNIICCLSCLMWLLWAFVKATFEFSSSFLIWSRLCSLFSYWLILI